MTAQRNSGPTPTRRTLVKGAAWSVPVVAMAGAAPAMAASGPDVIDWEISSACKIPGNSHGNLCYDKGYVLWAEFENPLATDLTITITGVTVGGIPRCIVGLADTKVSCTAPLGTQTFTIPAGGTRSIGIYTNASTDSSSTTVVVTFDYSTPTQPVQSGTTSGDVGGSPWQGSCRHPCASGQPMNACGTACAS